MHPFCLSVPNLRYSSLITTSICSSRPSLNWKTARSSSSPRCVRVQASDFVSKLIQRVQGGEGNGGRERRRAGGRMARRQRHSKDISGFVSCPAASRLYFHIPFHGWIRAADITRAFLTHRLFKTSIITLPPCAAWLPSSRSLKSTIWMGVAKSTLLTSRLVLHRVVPRCILRY